MFRKYLIGLFTVFVSSFGLFAGITSVSAASVYDGKSPYYNNCASTGRVVQTAKIADEYAANKWIYGTVQLKFSTSCVTTWGKVVLNAPLPSGYSAEAKIYRYYNGYYSTWTCASSGGSGAIRPGSTSCYTPMAYDGGSNNAYAIAEVWKTTGGDNDYLSPSTPSF